MSKRKKDNGRKAGIVWVLAMMLCATGVWCLLGCSIMSQVTVEVGEEIHAADFLVWKLPLPVELETDLTQIDLTVPGEHRVFLRWCGMRKESVLCVQDTVAPAGAARLVTTYSTRMPDAAELVKDVADATPVTIAYETVPDLTQEGEQQVWLTLTDLGGNVTRLNTTLTVLIDQEPPVISGVKNRIYYVGTELNLLDGVTASDNMDPAPVLTVDDSQVVLDVEGTYPVAYFAQDESGLATTVVAQITVIRDERPPQLLGVRPLTIAIGHTIAYRANVLVRDDLDDAPTLTVDSSQVNLSQTGTYPLIYRATDAAGNVTQMETTITVEERKPDYVEDSVIYAAADEILGKMITDDMDLEDQVNAIYDWATDHYWYVSSMDKEDWKQAAYQMMTKGSGDCFGFYSFARLMFERLGIPNLTLQRQPGYFLGSTHYWNMVSLDGGETWYHFDCCPRPELPPYMRMCLVTDADLAYYQKYYPDYYNQDPSLYPATPVE